MEKLILVRHGETDLNNERRLHQANDAERLNEKGKWQIKLAALALKKFSPADIYSSKEKRAAESGKIISEILKIHFEIIPDMQERNWGDFSGKTWPEVQTILSKLSLEERYAFVPPNGESWKECEARLIKAIGSVLDKNRGKTEARRKKQRQDLCASISRILFN